MRMRRLGWAGIELESRGERILVDLLVDPGMFAAFMGEPRDALIAPEPGARAALLTHLHRDHADVEAIEDAVISGGLVLRPPRATLTELDELPIAEAERALERSRLTVRSLAPGQSAAIGPFNVTAVEAVDGLGSPQVSWVIRADGRTVVHGGDTLWHGRWWHIARAFGPITVACLPANGVVLNYPNYQPAVHVPAALTPEQAVEAALALGAGALCPIHFNSTFDKPPFYRPADDPEPRLRAAGRMRGVPVVLLEPGEWVELAGASFAATPATTSDTPRNSTALGS